MLLHSGLECYFIELRTLSRDLLRSFFLFFGSILFDDKGFFFNYAVLSFD